MPCPWRHGNCRSTPTRKLRRDGSACNGCEIGEPRQIRPARRQGKAFRTWARQRSGVGRILVSLLVAGRLSIKFGILGFIDCMRGTLHCKPPGQACESLCRIEPCVGVPPQLRSVKRKARLQGLQDERSGARKQGSLNVLICFIFCSKKLALQSKVSRDQRIVRSRTG